MKCYRIRGKSLSDSVTEECLVMVTLTVQKDRKKLLHHLSKFLSPGFVKQPLVKVSYKI